MALSDDGCRQLLHTGFLPCPPPLRRLPSPFTVWEDLLHEAKHLARSNVDAITPEIVDDVKTWNSWRTKVENLPLLEFDASNYVEQVYKRAHHVLTFVLQFYVSSLTPVRSSQCSYIEIPTPIAVPLVAVSRYLGMAPILTYADTVLWNWELIDASKAVSVSNVRMLDLFTSSSQEEHFFLTSLKMEIVGRRALRAMGRSVTQFQRVDGARTDIENLLRELATITNVLSEITEIFCQVQDGLNAHFFYDVFRPFIQGADQGASSPSWSYSGTGLILQPSGPSAGQSAFMQSFDAFLGVKHAHGSFLPSGGCAYTNAALSPNNDISRSITAQCQQARHTSCFNHGVPYPTTGIQICNAGDQNRTRTQHRTDHASFNARMRAYMPATHQRCLLWLEKASPFQHDCDLSKHPELIVAKRRALKALSDWRDAHIRIVTKYVIIPARHNQDVARRLNGSISNETQVVRGTGGTSLIPLLQYYRNNTRKLAQPTHATTPWERHGGSNVLASSSRLGRMIVMIQRSYWSISRILDWASLTILILLCCYVQL